MSVRIHALVCALALSWVAAMAGAAPLPRAEPQEVGLDPARLARLSQALRQYVEDGKLAGGVALIARRGRIAYLDAFGQRDREARAPMREDTIFRIASQTKAIVSVAALMLQEEGKLLIGEPVSRYIPEFRQTHVAVPLEDGGYEIVKAKRPITIRDLLTHTAGISYGDGPAADLWRKAGFSGWYFADRDEPIAASIARMASLPFDAHPGERWIYGYSTDVLGVVIERVSGMSLDEFLRTRIFEPLGMRDTFFYVPADKRDRLATVYSISASGQLERAPDPGHMVGQGAYAEGPRKSFSGGAGLLSTAHDYARFLQMLLNGGELDGVRILSRKSVELMTSDHTSHVPPRFGGDGQGFGLGVYVVEDVGARGVHGSVGEFGWGGAYHTMYWVDPAEQLVVVYFTQLIPATGVDDHEKVRALIYQTIVD